MICGAALTVSHAFCAISLSSWPAPHPEYPSVTNTLSGPLPSAIASSTSFEVVSEISSEIASVELKFALAPCNTKPRSVCTGPPK